MKQTRDSHTLIGYLQGETLVAAFHRGKNGSPLTRTLKINNELWHCHSPDGIEFLLERELARTQRNSFDTLFLADPHILEPALKNSEEYLSTITEALNACATLRERGLIRRYGFSASSLSDLMPTLEKLKPKGYGGATVVSVEISVFSSELGLLDRLEGLTLFPRQSLEPLIGDRRIRLVEPQHLSTGEPRALLDLIARELTELKSIESRLNAPWASRIEKQFFEIRDRHTWEALLKEQIMPSTSSLTSELSARLNACLKTVSTYFEALENEQRQQIHVRLHDLFPSHQSLALKVLALFGAYAHAAKVDLSYDFDRDAQATLAQIDAPSFIQSVSIEKATQILEDFFS